VVSWGSQHKFLRLTVGTTAVPNLAKSLKPVGISIPVSQIVAPPVMDPESGFTSVRVGMDPSSVLGGAIAGGGASRGYVDRDLELRSGVVGGVRRREAVRLMRRLHDIAHLERHSEDWRPPLGGHSVRRRCLFAGYHRAGLEHFVGPLLVVPRSLLSLRGLNLSHDIEGERKSRLNHDVILAHVFKEGDVQTTKCSAYREQNGRDPAYK